MRIGIVGGGVVGRATARAYLEHAEVRVFDVTPERATHSLEAVLECDLVFLCLPTPQTEGKLECDTGAVDDFCNMLGGTKPDGCYVLRSTVPIGTTRRLAETYGLPNLVHSPEFLTARTAAVDAMTPTRNIVGIPNGGPSHDQFDVASERNKGAQSLVGLYERRFPGVEIIPMSSDESEAVKLFQNGFFAVKIAYFNEIRWLADKFGLNKELVTAGLLSDGRIAHAHTKVPGPDGKFGFGGACLPKDLASLVCQLQANETPGPLVTAAALVRNRKDRGRQ
jgi:UDPglucose 6-dehydrogenase